jgi:hypothetical protein
MALWLTIARYHGARRYVHQLHQNCRADGGVHVGANVALDLVAVVRKHHDQGLVAFDLAGHWSALHSDAQVSELIRHVASKAATLSISVNSARIATRRCS